MKTIIACLAAALMFAVAAQATPRGLYTKLLLTKFTPIPAGFYKASVGTSALSKLDKKHHSVGYVQVTLDSSAAIDYDVFPSWKDAQARVREGLSSPSGVKITATVDHGRVPGFGRLSRWRDLTVEGKSALGKSVTNGATLMCVPVDITDVCAETLSTDNDSSGDIPATISLLHAAVRHLARVRVS